MWAHVCPVCASLAISLSWYQMRDARQEARYAQNYDYISDIGAKQFHNVVVGGEICMA